MTKPDKETRVFGPEPLDVRTTYVGPWSDFLTVHFQNPHRFFRVRETVPDGYIGIEYRALHASPVHPIRIHHPGRIWIRPGRWLRLTYVGPFSILTRNDRLHTKDHRVIRVEILFTFKLTSPTPTTIVNLGKVMGGDAEFIAQHAHVAMFDICKHTTYRELLDIENGAPCRLGFDYFERRGFRTRDDTPSLYEKYGIRCIGIGISNISLFDKEKWLGSEPIKEAAILLEEENFVEIQYGSRTRKMIKH